MRVVGTLTALVALAAVSPARADCTCRGPGVIAHHGETICLRTPTGPRLARCEMLLNNSSWTFLNEPCPEASLETGSMIAAAISSAPPDPVLVR